MFYDVFAELCKKRGISPSKAAEECGINKSNVSNWKNNGYVPRGDALNKIADYFGVSVDYLLGNEQKGKPIASESDGPIIIRRLRKGVDKMDEKQQEKMMNILKATFDDIFEDDD